MATAHLAIDLGASSGRAILGVLDGHPLRLRLEEVHRFEHRACPTPAGPVWDLTGIWQHVLTGLRTAQTWCADHHLRLTSIGVDAWGVDWVLIGKSGETLTLPRCYRDPQNEVVCERVLQRLGGFSRLYERTGIQLLPFNTLFQIAARHEHEPRLLESADRLLFLPDLLHFWLSGVAANELTIASTSAMLCVESPTWDRNMLTELGLPTHLLGELVAPGTVLGTLRSEVAEVTGAPQDVRVITPASHDTASAVAAVPAADDESWAYLSSGTWSLLGAELGSPIVNERSQAIPFTNERGVDDTYRFLKNIAGLWPLQELRRELAAAGKDRTFAELTAAATTAAPSHTFIDANHPQLARPGRMGEKLRQLARLAQQPEPASEGSLVRFYLESLAHCYRETLDQLESLLGRKLQTLHVVGGGIQNRLLNELTAEAVDCQTRFGPVEATAIGNLLIQATACEVVGDGRERRAIVARSFPQEVGLSP